MHITFIFLLIGIGYGIGFYIRDKRGAAAIADYQRQAEHQLDALRQQIATLNQQSIQWQQQAERYHLDQKKAEGQLEALRWQITILDQQAMKRDRADEQRKLNKKKNDLSNTENQRRFISQCDMQAKQPVNGEAVKVLYAIEEYIKTCRPEWRFAFEVSLGAFVATAGKSGDWYQDQAFKSYNSKRADFLLIDRYGKPVMVIEYNGSGHNLSEKAADRMAVKRLVLEKAGIPLLEIPEKMPRSDIIAAISEVVAHFEKTGVRSRTVVCGCPASEPLINTSH
ncbi:DUF2726 domain-containing protein [Granulibacter bethesdensis]|nr:DUF2726 domain-containing protein [Granulibacter bethesdensis]